MNAMRNNVAGGKGRWGDRASEAGKRQGVAGETGPQDPGGVEPRDKVRELRRGLWGAAKRARGRRCFHAVYDPSWQE
jgi:RNA-directed DNA polymerase